MTLEVEEYDDGTITLYVFPDGAAPWCGATITLPRNQAKQLLYDLRSVLEKQ